MGLYDFRSVVASAIQARGGGIDPALYTAQHASTATTFGSLTVKPEGMRGPFLAFGVQGAVASGTLPLSKIEIFVGGSRKITLAPTFRDALVHNFGATRGIIFSRWPAPLFVGEGKSIQISENTIASGNLASVAYLIAGFHTDRESAEWAMRTFGELRSYSFNVAPVAADEGGNAYGQFTTAEELDLIEYCVNNIDASPGALDFIRTKLESLTLLDATRISGTLSVYLPAFLGYPSQYIGRKALPGQTLTVQERVSATSRTDVWSMLAVAGRAGPEVP